jgi:hypothetical protein
VTHDDDSASGRETDELRGWPYVRAVILTAVLGGAYVMWKYYKHHVLLPDLGQSAWVFYAVGVAGILIWGIATRFGTKRRRVS